jgi:hypothetical protein
MERFAWRYPDEELHAIAARAPTLAGAAAKVRLMFGHGAHAMAAAQSTRRLPGHDQSADGTFDTAATLAEALHDASGTHR